MTTIPCRTCGRSIANAQHLERVTMTARARLANGLVAAREKQVSVEVTTCADCSGRLDRARAILEAHPLARQPLGSLSYVLDLADGALSALDVLRIKPGEQEALCRTDLDVARLLHHLGRVASVRYIDQELMDDGTGSRKPWEHVTGYQRDAMRDEYAALLRARAEQPADVPPPDDGAAGCLLCGVATVHVLPSRAGAAWGPLRQLLPGTNGGPASAPAVSGYVCHSCSSAAEGGGLQGALGPTAVQRGLLAHLDVRVPPWGEVVLADARPWAALPPGTTPNDTPWAHLPLERLAEEARQAVTTGAFANGRRR